MRHRSREIVSEIEIPDADVAAVRAREPDEHSDRRRLSRPVGAEEAEDLPGTDFEGDIRHNLTLAEAPRKAFCLEDDLACARSLRSSPSPPVPQSPSRPRSALRCHAVFQANA